MRKHPGYMTLPWMLDQRQENSRYPDSKMRPERLFANLNFSQGISDTSVTNLMGWCSLGLWVVGELGSLGD